MGILAEGLKRLQFAKFLQSVDQSQFMPLSEAVGKLQSTFKDVDTNSEIVELQWSKFREEMPHFIKLSAEFKEAGSKRSDQFRYWNTFLEYVMPTLRDLTRSHRESNWNLHLSAVRRALPLCFALD